MITGRTPVYGLLGSPVAHSRSPEMHNHWFAHHGIDGVYVAFEVAPHTTGQAVVDAVKTLGLARRNVPHKNNAKIYPPLNGLMWSKLAA